MHSKKVYVIGTPGASDSKEVVSPREQVHYDGFFAFDEENITSVVERILSQSREKSKAVVVTASVLSAKNHGPVIDALNVIGRAKETGADDIGNIYLVACENTVSAFEVMHHEDLAVRIAKQAADHVRAVHALVDRVCVEVEEVMFEGEPTVMVRAEEYGSLKLELGQDTDDFLGLLAGSRVQFSRHLDVEKEIKSWLLNGSHWLIALTAFRETGGNPELRLNEFIMGTRDHELYAFEVLDEMRDGIEALLRSKPQYEGFVRDVDVTAYLKGAADSILARFKANGDPITRILARFRAPCRDEVTTVQSFVDRFLHRIDPPLLAYQAEHGVPAKSATQGIFNLFRLQASGTYVDTVNANHSQAA